MGTHELKITINETLDGPSEDSSKLRGIGLMSH